MAITDADIQLYVIFGAGILGLLILLAMVALIVYFVFYNNRDSQISSDFGSILSLFSSGNNSTPLSNIKYKKVPSGDDQQPLELKDIIRVDVSKQGIKKD